MSLTRQSKPLCKFLDSGSLPQACAAYMDSLEANVQITGGADTSCTQELGKGRRRKRGQWWLLTQKHQVLVQRVRNQLGCLTL